MCSTRMYSLPSVPNQSSIALIMFLNCKCWESMKQSDFRIEEWLYLFYSSPSFPNSVALVKYFFN